MLSNELQTIYVQLGTLAGEVAPDAWETVRLCRERLKAATDFARNLETVVPLAPESKNANQIAQ